MQNNTEILSFGIGALFFIISIGWVVFIYKLILNKSVEDAKIDKLIDLGKWFMVSVAMVLGASIVSDSFRAREQDMKEMELFDKYVSTIIQVEGIEQRWLLSEYFATVSPSGKLKEAWVDYHKLLEPPYDEYKQNKEKIAILETKDSNTVQDAKKLASLYQSNMVYEKSLAPPISIAPEIDRRIDIEIFYLEGEKTEVLRGKAQEIADQIDPTKFNVRVRLLSAKKNLGMGFQIKENQIHYDSGAEMEMAREINEGQSLGFKMIRTGAKPTPFYFSIFVAK